MPDVATMLSELRAKANLSELDLAIALGTSRVSINRWERRASIPSREKVEQIEQLYNVLQQTGTLKSPLLAKRHIFASRGVRRPSDQLSLFETPSAVTISPSIFPPIIKRLRYGRFFPLEDGELTINLLNRHIMPAETIKVPPSNGMSAGKNTYTYDAHTYHTKVPPQGIAELIHDYLPRGGLVFDPFAGSGMTGVAAVANGYDCILNELSPAACFIANRFTSYIDPGLFRAGVDAVLDELHSLRHALYSTECRECGQKTEILYTVWSYRVICTYCKHEFLIWDRCRRYGRTVREHKILNEFSCPSCNKMLKKSTLQRTVAEPVLLGYKCCSHEQKEHPLMAADWDQLRSLEEHPPLAEGFYPANSLPTGVNLRQPIKHGLDRIDKFYTLRNLAAMSHLWKTIHRIESTNLAAFLAFAFTSLYQRVTRLSEFRFWGGSGNTARFNVPYIFNEANVFVTFLRKARTIEDHLRATASHYDGKAIVVQNSATSLDYLHNESVDLIFTDPPFGANINYSEMNFLWESWLGTFTDATSEAIVNQFQNKGVAEYQRLMTQSLKECFRVLRTGHWMLVVFMNSSSEVWSALRSAIYDAGFTIEKIDIFDKQHGTFKQFVSENTAGADLVLHCLKPPQARPELRHFDPLRAKESIIDFLRRNKNALPTQVYIHVERDQEIDFRKLYSEWLSQALIANEIVDFSEFRSIVQQWLDGESRRG